MQMGIIIVDLGKIHNLFEHYKQHKHCRINHIHYYIINVGI